MSDDHEIDVVAVCSFRRQIEPSLGSQVYAQARETMYNAAGGFLTKLYKRARRIKGASKVFNLDNPAVVLGFAKAAEIAGVDFQVQDVLNERKQKVLEENPSARFHQGALNVLAPIARRTIMARV